MIIIQWNIKGHLNKYSYLQLVIKKYKPVIVVLQETHIPMNKIKKHVKQYTIYFPIKLN